MLSLDSPGWGLDAMMMTLLCNRNIVMISKEVDTGWSNSRDPWQNFLSKSMTKKG
jgi:hypothetical protein